MKYCPVLAGALAVAVASVVVSVAPTAVSHTFVKPESRTSEVEARGFSPSAESSVRALGDLDDVIDVASALKSSSGRTPSSLTIVDVPPVRRAGRPSLDRNGMDPKRVAYLDDQRIRSRLFRENVKTLPESEREKYAEMKRTASRSWRAKNGPKKKLMNAAQYARRKLRKLADAAGSTSSTQLPPRSLAAKRGHSHANAQVSSTTPSSFTAHTTEDARTSPLLVRTKAQRAGRAPFTDMQERTRDERAVAAPSATTPRSSDATAEPEHRYESIFEDLFGSGSPTSSRTAFANPMNPFDLNGSPPPSPTL